MAGEDYNEDNNDDEDIDEEQSPVSAAASTAAAAAAVLVVLGLDVAAVEDGDAYAAEATSALARD